MTGTRFGGWAAGRAWSIAALIAASIGLGALIVSATADGLVFYRTPTEVMQEVRDDGVLRVGGLVLEGSVVRDDTTSALVITDGASEIDVRYAGPLPAVVQEGEGAVVEGRWAPGGVIEATDILLRHSNEYRPPEEEIAP